MLGSRTPVVLVALCLLCCAMGAAFAADIVTLPTANQLKAGEVDLATYYIAVDNGGLIVPLRSLGIDSIRVQTIYAGLTDKIELDIHRYDVDLPAGFNGVTTIFNASYLVVTEDAKKPNVVLGGRDLTSELGHASWYAAAAKTLNPPVGGPPTGPIYRVHLGLGTEDNTLFGEPRHEGLFGGLQVCVVPTYPMVGAIALYDGQDIITGLTYTYKPTWPTIKAGTFGGHSWVGLNYTFNCKQ